jgi:hypothetical protein
MRTTEDLFEKQLHAYTITHAIEDGNVLRFHVDYFKPKEEKGKKAPKPGEAIAKRAIIEAILSKHDAATGGRRFNAILATSSINDAIEYHALFKKMQAEKLAENPDYEPLNIACVFSPPDEGDPDVKQLQEDLLQEKEDNERLRTATGWHVGLDGAWRYELPDFQIKTPALKGDDPDVMSLGLLGGMIKHPSLFRWYPELRNWFVHITDTLPAGTRGRMNEKDKAILIALSAPYHDKRRTLIHEIQHAIQEIEGFAKGGDLSTPEVVQHSRARFEKARQEAGDRLANHLAARQAMALARFGHAPSAQELDQWDAEHPDWKEQEDLMRELVSPEATAIMQRDSRASAYLDLTGETEARIAAQRLDLPPAMSFAVYHRLGHARVLIEEVPTREAAAARITELAKASPGTYEIGYPPWTLEATPIYDDVKTEDLITKFRLADSAAPRFGWDVPDVQPGGPWTRKAVADFLSVPADKSVYRAMVDLGDLTPVRAERQAAAESGSQDS